MTMKPKFVWRKGIGMQAGSELLFCGKVLIATARYDGFSGKSEPDKYRITSNLPQLKQSNQRFENMDEAKQIAQEWASIWFKALAWERE